MKNTVKILIVVLLASIAISCKKTDYSISISTDIKESSVVITKNTPVSIMYNVNSPSGILSLTVESSANILTKHLPEDDFNGVVTASLRESGENSFVKIIADNGTNKAEYILYFEMESLVSDGETDIEAGANGGNITLKIKSNVDYEVVIPSEAQSWVSVADNATKTMVPYSITLKLEKNEDVTRSTSVTVRSKSAAEIKTVFNISQAGILKNLIITCCSSSIVAPTLLGNDPSGKIFWGDGYSAEWIPQASHTYNDGVKDHLMEIHTTATGFEFAGMFGVSKINLKDF